MKHCTRVLALALSAAAIALAAVPAAHAQPNHFPNNPPPPPMMIPGGGTDLFRALLDKAEIQPISSNELNGLWPSDDLIVVVFGSTDVWGDWQRDPLRWARLAISVNGAAIIASDNNVRLHSANQGNALGQLNGTTVFADLRDCHDWHHDCPYVVPVSPDELRNPPDKPGRVWSVFRGLNKLATNQPSYIEEPFRYQAEFQYPLARLPKSSFTAQGDKFNPPPLFAIGGDGLEQFNGRPGYSFLTVADSSVYINQMIMEPGTDNLEFTLRTIEYLQGPDKHRRRCVFFENGKIVDRFDGLRQTMKPQKKIPPEAVPNVGAVFGKNQDKLVNMLNDRADKLQTSDFLHESMVGSPGSSRERRRFGTWVEWVATTLAIFVIFWLLRRSFRSRHATDVPPPPVTGAGAASTGPPGVFDRRQKELVRRNNLYEPVRNLMRTFFDSVGAPSDPGPRMPRIVITHEVRKPDSLRQALRDMWRIAYGPPLFISAQRWFELEPYFERIRIAHADGKWRFETDEEA